MQSESPASSSQSAVALCECGCGEPAGVYSTSNSRAGIKAGDPKRFIHGHHNRLQQPQGPESLDGRYTVLPNGCWQWHSINEGNDGYGIAWVRGRRTKAHRAMYERERGPIPSGFQLDHLCRNRGCVNPAHLEVVTQAENCRRGANAKINQRIADEIRTRLANGETGVALAREYGVSTSTISFINTRTIWA